MQAVRPAAVAGSFYPGERARLAAEVDALLCAVGSLEPRLGWPKAIVVPHAGYVYSGRVAAAAYDRLAAGRGAIRRVVLLGPVHRVPVRGLAAPASAAFDTPLGRVPVDRAALEALSDLQQLVASERAHAWEHSLEVQLPFLQRALGEFALVPLAVGEASPEEVAEVLERLWGGAETAIVVSTDLSHYLSYGAARAVDARTLARIEALATDLDPEEACGALPLNGLLALLRRRGLGIERLAYCNSGDTAGDRERVVGYAALAVREEPAPAPEAAGAVLLGLARGAIRSALGLGVEARAPAAAWLSAHAATFVTLRRGAELRGCIGSLEAARPLADDVRENARTAALRDPRFAPLAANDWPQLSVEVSLLGPMRPLAASTDAELYAALEAGRDGLVVAYDGRRATLLPQVWTGLPDARRFVAQLLAKAGIPAHTPVGRCRFWRYRVRKWSDAPGEA